MPVEAVPAGCHDPFHPEFLNKLAATLFNPGALLNSMAKDSQPSISQERLTELFEEIRDRLDEMTEKLDHVIDHLSSRSYNHHAYDSNLDDH